MSFPLGIIVKTRGVNKEYTDEEVTPILARFINEDWGDVHEDTASDNELAIQTNRGRVMGGVYDRREKDLDHYGFRRRNCHHHSIS